MCGSIGLREQYELGFEPGIFVPPEFDNDEPYDESHDKSFDEPYDELGDDKSHDESCDFQIMLLAFR